MARTIRRQPFSVSTNSNDYSKRYTSTLVNFKGLYDGKNEIATDASTFVDAENIYVDDDNVLVSRPPFKFYDGEAYIIDQWMFGAYGLRLYRLPTDDDGKLTEGQNSYFTFCLKCITHDTITGTVNGNNVYEMYTWEIPVDTIGTDFVPKVTCVQIEDKIFVWFAGISLVALNTAGIIDEGKIYLYFEDAVKYLYFPIHKLVINGIESDFETKNFLTNTYRRRYQYNALSDVNFERLIDKHLHVNLKGDLTQNTSQHLYDIDVQSGQERVMIYPYSSIGNGYYVDVVQTPNATVIMRYDTALKLIEVSFDGRYFRALPSLKGTILGNPLITKDGFYIVAFTTEGLAKCQLATQEADFQDETNLFGWVIDKYLRRAMNDGKSMATTNIQADYIPTGHFETIDQFAYVLWLSMKTATGDTVNRPMLYTEWLHGSNGIAWAIKVLSNDDGEGNFISCFLTDDIRIHFRYIAPIIEEPMVGPTISILGAEFQYTPEHNREALGFLNYKFRVNPEEFNRVLRTDDFLTVTEGGKTKSGYVQRLTAGGALYATDTDVHSGDMIFFAPFPVQEAETAPNYTSSGQYTEGQLVWKDDILHRYEEGTLSEVKDISGKAVPRYYIREELLTSVGSLIPQPVTVRQDWKSYLLLKTLRYTVTNLENDEAIAPTYRIKISPVVDTGIKYSLTDLNNLGMLSITKSDGTYVGSWDVKYPGGMTLSFELNEPEEYIITGDAIIAGVKNPGYLDKQRGIALTADLVYEDKTYEVIGLNTPVTQMDVHALVPEIDAGIIFYKYVFLYSLKTRNKNNLDEIKTFDVRLEVTDKYSNTEAVSSVKTIIPADSKYLRISPNTVDFVTDNYLYANNRFVALPNGGKLSSIITDTNREIVNNDKLILTLKNGDEIQSYTGNIHKISTSGTLVFNTINSGDCVIYYDGEITQEIARDTSKWYTIQKLSVKNGEWVILDGPVHTNDLIRLVSHTDFYDAPDWQIGDDWPFINTYPPLIPEGNGVRFWQPGDNLPTGSVIIYGCVNISVERKPLAINATGIWYEIDGMLWTSQLSANNMLELDEYVNATLKVDGTYDVDTNLVVPDDVAILSEYCFAFNNTVDGFNTLEITTTKRDEDKLLTDEGSDFLLYLPKANRQKFANPITNLHSVSDTEIGVFTEEEIWYVKAIIADNGIISYTKPIKSKVPVGCRPGDDVITALDGQVLVFPTARGIVAMTPTEFTTGMGQSLSYLSDAIQEQYNEFYNDSFVSASMYPNEFESKYPSKIKIAIYKYWLLFYRYMDKTIFAFDTRTNSWWRWTTPYPIKSMMTGSRLIVLMQLDFSPIGEQKQSLMGVSFLWSDREIRITNDADLFPSLEYNKVANIGYYDDTVDKALDGTSELIYDNDFVGARRVLHYASPRIDWHFTSQRLHFDQINNYKAIKALNINVKGTEAFKAKLSTKAFRDFYHPEQGDTVEINVNDLRTFIKRLNLMHVVNFQYRLENDKTADIPHQLKLNSISIKYEIKEAIR